MFKLTVVTEKQRKTLKCNFKFINITKAILFPLASSYLVQVDISWA